MVVWLDTFIPKCLVVVILIERLFLEIIHGVSLSSHSKIYMDHRINGTQRNLFSNILVF